MMISSNTSAGLAIIFSSLPSRELAVGVAAGELRVVAGIALLKVAAYFEALEKSAENNDNQKIDDILDGEESGKSQRFAESAEGVAANLQGSPACRIENQEREGHHHQHGDWAASFGLGPGASR